MFLRFKKNKNVTLDVSLSCCTRFLEHCWLRQVHYQVLYKRPVYLVTYLSELSRTERVWENNLKDGVGTEYAAASLVVDNCITVNNWNKSFSNQQFQISTPVPCNEATLLRPWGTRLPATNNVLT